MKRAKIVVMFVAIVVIGLVSILMLNAGAKSICDKCKKDVTRNNYVVQMIFKDLGLANVKIPPLYYDLCKPCGEKFLAHVDDFFVQKKAKSKKKKSKKKKAKKK